MQMSSKLKFAFPNEGKILNNHFHKVERKGSSAFA